MDKDNQVFPDVTANVKRKDVETSSVTTQIEEREISLPSTNTPNATSPSNEIDLSQPTTGSKDSDDFLTEGTKEKRKSSSEDSHIAIMNPNDVVFQVETQPESTDPEEKKERELADKKSASPSKHKTGKLPKGEEGDKKRLLKKIPSKKIMPKTVKPAPPPITISKGVAYLSGNVIKLTGGVKLSPGEEIKIGEREFVLRKQRRKNTVIYVSVILLLIFASLLFSPLFKSTNSGQLIGIVMEEKTKTFLPHAKIYLKETNKTIQSNDLGFFVLTSLPPGLYTLQVQSTGYKLKKENVTITKDQPTTVRVQLEPLASSDLYSDATTKATSPEEINSKTTSSDMSAMTSEDGTIKIKSNVSDPVIRIDQQLVGTGNKTYRNVESGKHIVTATKEGYYDWAGEVNVGPGQTLNLEITLSEDKSYHSSAQTWKDFIDLGKTQLNSNDFNSALTSYNQALTLKPDAPEALWGRGYTLIQMGEKSKALEDLKKASKLFINDQDYQNAIICYTNLITLNDQNKEFYLDRGDCYLRSGQYEKSVQDLKKAIQLDLNLFPGYLLLGEAYYKSGEYKLSIETFKHARKLNPTNPQVYTGLIKAYLAKGDKSEAKKSYKKFEELSTYIERENMKQDPEWRKILEEIEVGS